ncbi:MAG: hypothetical protein HQM14_01855 [SAR324 cluster bacterium]|nr:hypothetical protein [SAR324 cluster bacterium]
MIFVSANIRAADLEDFVGGVSSARITTNPASVGLINSFHIQYDGAQYDAPDSTGQTFVSDSEYETGVVTQGSLIFAMPIEDWFSVGISFSGQFERYDSEVTLVEEIKRNSKEKITRLTSGFLIGMPFDLFTIGASFNRHDIVTEKEVKFFNVTTDEADSKFKGSAVLNSVDYGIIIPNIFDIIDFGVTYIPSKEGIIEYDIKKGSTKIEATEEFEEPGQVIYGIGYSYDLESSIFQFLGDVGSITQVKKNFLGEAGDGGNTKGGLIRYAYPPLLDISYGIREEELASLTIRTETASLQLPIYIGTIKIGTQRILLLDDEGTVADITIPKFSFNVQFGERVGRALELKPKTKKITFIDRL